MSKPKSFLCVVELKIKAVSAPGVWLPREDKLYLSIVIFGQYKISKVVRPVFPLSFLESFQFDKIFFDHFHPIGIIQDDLKNELVVIELIKVSSNHHAQQIAGYAENASSFFFPDETLLPVYSNSQRELLMTRASSSLGIAPKVEFYTKTVFYEEPLLSSLYSLKGIRNATKTESILFHKSKSGRKGKSKSVSPTCNSSEIISGGNSPQKSVFAVRHLDQSLIGRQPGLDPKEAIKKAQRSHSAQPRKRNKIKDFVESSTSENSIISPHKLQAKKSLSPTARYRYKQMHSWSSLEELDRQLTVLCAPRRLHCK